MLQSLLLDFYNNEKKFEFQAYFIRRNFSSINDLFLKKIFGKVERDTGK
jgi:hypothetical protein